MEKRKKISLTILKLTSFFLIGVLISLFYQWNVFIVLNYQLNNQAKKLKEVENQNQRLKISGKEIEILNNLENLALANNFEKNNQSHYLKIFNGSVVIQK